MKCSFFPPSFSPAIPRGLCGREKPAPTSLEHTHLGDGVRRMSGPSSA